MTDQPVMVDRGRAPRPVAPPGACGTRSHLYGPHEQYPHHPGRGPDLVAGLATFERRLARIGFEPGPGSGR